MPDKVYTVKEAAKILKVSKYAIYDLVKQKKLVASRVAREYRFSESDIQKFLKENRTA